MSTPALVVAPTLNLLDQALRWADHAVRCDAKPAYIRQKALEAVRFAVAHGAQRFCLPSKLVGTSTNQDAIKAVHAAGVEPGRLRLTVELSEKDRVEVFFDGKELGRLQAKHARWVRPLLRQDPDAVAVSALQVTGGTEAKPTHGLNVVLWFPRPVEEQSSGTSGA